MLPRFVPIATLIFVAGCDNPLEPEPIALEPGRLAVGEASVCALDKVGEVFCWGVNSEFWEYGADAGTLTPSSLPIAVPVPTLAKLSSGSAQHMCGIMANQEAVCWGRGAVGQLGGGTLGDIGNAATMVEPGATWGTISVSRLTTCAISLAGGGQCWGHNQRGEVGDSLVALGTRSTLPVPVRGGNVFTSIVAGWLHACGLAAGGVAYCWGDNSSGQLGLGFSGTDVIRGPVQVSTNERFVQLTLGSRNTCGITVDHRAFCWGFNGTGQLGDGTTIDRYNPTAVAGKLKFIQVVLSSGFGGGTAVARPISSPQGGVAHTCALTTEGAPYCWGWNGAGQLGDGTTDDRLVPTLVLGNLRLTAIGLGGSSTCGMRDVIWCWGSNQFGQLGIGSEVDATSPAKVFASFVN